MWCRSRTPWRGGQAQRRSYRYYNAVQKRFHDEYRTATANEAVGGTGGKVAGLQPCTEQEHSALAGRGDIARRLMALVDDVVRPWAARCVQPLPHPTKQEHSALASRADRAQELEVMVEELEALVGCLQPLQAERDEADEHAKQLQQQV